MGRDEDPGMKIQGPGMGIQGGSLDPLGDQRNGEMFYQNIQITASPLNSHNKIG